MRNRNLFLFGGAMLAGVFLGSLLGPSPVQAVAREIIELQRDVSTILQGQRDMSTSITQDHTVLKTLLDQSNDNVLKLNSTMGSLQKSVQDVQANSGARLDTLSTQIQGLSDNLEEVKSRIGKLNQQLTDVQNAIQTLDAKFPSAGAAPSAPVTPGAAPPSPGSTTPASSPSADNLYTNGLRDKDSGKFDLARQEFLDYLKYFPETDLASNAQFYLGEIAYAEKKYDQAITEYDKVLTNYPKSFKLAPARLKKGLAYIELGQKATGLRELREVIRRYPGTEEERRARAKLKELGFTAPTAYRPRGSR